jgi:hypothetical protein
VSAVPSWALLWLKLVYKGKGKLLSLPASFRQILLEKASAKIFFGMMADRTVSFVCANNYLSPLQKAAHPGVAGALEHQLLFDTLASQARGAQRGLVDQVTDMETECCR